MSAGRRLWTLYLGYCRRSQQKKATCYSGALDVLSIALVTFGEIKLANELCILQEPPLPRANVSATARLHTAQPQHKGKAGSSGGWLYPRSTPDDANKRHCFVSSGRNKRTEGGKRKEGTAKGRLDAREQIMSMLQSSQSASPYHSNNPIMARMHAAFRSLQRDCSNCPRIHWLVCPMMDPQHQLGVPFLEQCRNSLLQQIHACIFLDGRPAIAADLPRVQGPKEYRQIYAWICPSVGVPDAGD